MRADINGLKAVRGELGQSLDRARESLETFIEEEAGRFALEAAIGELHQVHGSLQVLRLHSAALLLADMQQTAQSIIDGELEADESLFDVLFGAGLQLSDFLDYLPRAEIEADLILLPIINELRVAAGRPVLGEDELFVHTLAADPLEAIQLPFSGDGGDLQAAAKAALPRFQAALLGVLKQSEGTHLQQLSDIAETLQQAGDNADFQRLWWVTGAVLEALASEALITGIEIKRLLGRLGMLLRNLASQGAMAYGPGEQALEYGLLYELGRSAAAGAKTQSVRDAYALTELLPAPEQLETAREQLRGPSTALLGTVAAEVRKDLSVVRDNIDLLMRSGELSAEHSEQTSDALMRVSATLGMLGLEDLQRVVDKQVKVIESGQSAPDPEDPAWQGAATTLLWIDHSLEHILLSREQDGAEAGTPLEPAADAISPQELHSGTRSILREALVNLQRVQEQVSEFADSRDEAALADTAGLLHEVSAGLGILRQDAAATLIGRLRDSIVGLDSNPVAMSRVADALADAAKLLEALRDEHSDSAALLTELESYLDAMGAAPKAAESEVPAVEDLEMPDEEAAPEAEVAEPELEASSAEDDIRAVFLEELEDVQNDLAEQLPAWQADPANQAALSDVRRAFHTLKGSGRMVGAEDIGEYGWAIENLLNRCLEGSQEVSDDIAALVEQAVAGLPLVAEQYAAGGDLPLPAAALIAQAHALAGTEAPAAYQAVGEVETLEEPPAEETVVEEAAAEETPVEEVPADEGEDLKSVFTQDALEQLEQVAGFLAEAGPQLDPLMVSHEVVRAFHTLKSGSALAGLDGMSALAAELEALCKQAHNTQEPLASESLQLVQEATGGLLSTMEAYQQGSEVPDLAGLVEDIVALRSVEAAGEEEEIDEALLAFTEDAYSLTEQLEARLSALESAAGDQDERDRLLAGLQALGDRAQSAGIESIAQLADRMRSHLESVTDLSSGQRQIFADVTMGVYELLDELRQGQTQPAIDDLLGRLDGFEAEAATEVAEPEEVEAAPEVAEADLPAEEEVVEAVVEEAPEPAAVETAAPVEDESPELAALFQEEAEDLLEGIDQSLDAWEAEPESAEPAAELLRLLHTIKGGARMAGAPGIGDIGHALESQIEVQNRAGQPPSGDFLADLRGQVDRMHGLLDAFRKPAEAPAPAVEAAPEPAMPAGPSTWAESLYWQPETSTDTAAAAAGESARVPVGSLDQMLNEAGEISIYRGRMEQHHADLEAQLGEFEQAVDRLRRLLRELDKETDAQVRARREQIQASADRYDTDFDPLEMDRYTRMNELSRSLNESAADLASLHGLMNEATQDAETLLLQQGRVVTSLQHGLMDTLLVPFSRQVQRMQRLVRQTSQSHDRSARLEFEGEENELDRNVLDRMTGPLEHLLRNAVVHGIEDAKRRKKAGKEEEGTIRVTLRRDGTQSLIEVSDDGGGLDIKAIRKQAEVRGLVPKKRKIEDDVLRQLIFEPGFSTAEEVTQEAGRGVGMDVVNAEIKQLGGTISVDSVVGQGTRFTIRIPSSLAITNALLIQVGLEHYAIPMASIAGIERLPRETLNAELEAGEAAQGIEYGGQRYRVIRLADYLGVAHVADEDADENRNLSVLLIQAGDNSLALIVDKVLGGQELVVKSLGPQVSAIAGVKGGAILADGSVVLILDVQALHQAQRRRGLVSEDSTTGVVEQVLDQRPMVMVVDDSITIRRVTEKFLLRNGYRVCMAKDGMDALPKLQTEAPDLVLLDIEMPRIDGFEFATYMRNSEQFVNIPIIMITSRSGEKHQQRAAQIGVQEYMVKPYQEDVLLATIKDVLEQAGGAE